MSRFQTEEASWMATGIAEQFVGRVMELAEMSSLQSFDKRDCCEVVEAVISHLLNYVRGRIVIDEGDGGVGVIVSHVHRNDLTGVTSTVRATGFGPYAFCSALCAVIAHRDGMMVQHEPDEATDE